MKYDIFYVSKNKINNIDWQQFRSRFPSAQKIENITAIDDVKEKTFTKFFWLVWDDVTIAYDFNFDYCVESWDEEYVHVWKNSCNEIDSFVSGVALIPKKANILQKEFDFKFYINKKEIDKVASKFQYPIRTIASYEEYLEIINDISKTMVWVMWPDIEIVDNSIFDLYFDPLDGKYDYDRTINHVFKNKVNNEESYISGVSLCCSTNLISKKEFDHRFFVHKKEVDIIASKPKPFDKFVIENYQDYLNAKQQATTEMFWAVWSDVIVDSNFTFDYHVPVYDVFHRNITHVFKNGDTYDGICLFSKNITHLKREVDHRFFVHKKEVDIIASKPKPFDKFVIENYQDYLNAKQQATTEMFWIVPKEVEVLDSFNFDTYFSHHNIVERKLNHAFKHMFRNEETYFGIALVPRSYYLSKKEINFRFLVEKKEHDIVASKNKLYDIFFISYNESIADESYEKLKIRFPRIKRIHGIKGIHNAHIAAAKQADSHMFWVVDGDAIVTDQFQFDYEASVYEKQTVHVWHSKNPINNLTYGYGGVKLLPRQLTLDMDVTSVDMTMSISDKFKVINEVSNVTAFNTDPFATWKSAFRECVKLASRPIDAEYQEETEDRLITWCNLGADKLHGEHCISGARAGRQYGLDNITNPEALVKINDFDWLQNKFTNKTLL